MLKDQLMQEAQEIDASVELDSIFESVELSPEVQETFKTVFETTVKKHAIALAESHITAIAEKSDALVAEAVEQKVAEVEQKLTETSNKMFEHVAAEWLSENAVEVEKGIKAQLFDTMFEGLKELFIEHNVSIPAESVDVVAEMEEELQEAKEETSKLFEAKNQLAEEVKALKREKAVNEATAELTESQKEKVLSLIEGITYGDHFEKQLNAIVEMASVVKEEKLDESVITESSDINKNIEAESLNYVVEVADEVPAEKQQTSNPAMSAYIAAAKRI